MGAIMTTPTIKDLCHQYGVSADSLRKKNDRAGKLVAWDINRPLKPKEEANIKSLIGVEVDTQADAPKVERTTTTATTDAEGRTQDMGQDAPKVERTKTSYRVLLFRFIFALGIIAHATLVAYDCWYLWGTAGAIAGAVVLLVIVGAVVLLAGGESDETTANLMWFVSLLDMAAFFVHRPCLYHQGTNAYGVGIGMFGAGCLAAVVCLCAIALIYFYRETGLKK